MTAAQSHCAISVLIPAYNAEPYVAEAVESVLAQSLPPAEIVVFDDGSTDRTYAKLQSYGDRIRLLGPERLGVVGAKNYLLQQARYPWVAYQDADDLWMPDKLEKQVAWLEANPGHDGCFTMAAQFLQPGCTLPPRFRNVLLEEPNAQPFIQSLLIPRQVFERVGPLIPHETLGADSDWFLRARDAGVKIGVVPEVLFRRRWHETNLSYQQDFKKGMLSILRRSVARKRQTGSNEPASGNDGGQAGA